MRNTFLTDGVWSKRKSIIFKKHTHAQWKRLNQPTENEKKTALYYTWGSQLDLFQRAKLEEIEAKATCRANRQLLLFPEIHKLFPSFCNWHHCSIDSSAAISPERFPSELPASPTRGAFADRRKKFRAVQMCVPPSPRTEPLVNLSGIIWNGAS